VEENLEEVCSHRDPDGETGVPPQVRESSSSSSSPDEEEEEDSSLTHSP